MTAMQMTATIRYIPTLFLLSVALAVVVSLVALKLFLKFRQQTRMASKKPQIIGAIVMAAGILLLHYTGMAAATFKANYDRYNESFSIDTGLIAFLMYRSSE